MIVMGIVSPIFILIQQTKILMGDPVINYEISNGMWLIGAIFIILHLSFLVTLIIVESNFMQMIDEIYGKCTDSVTELIFKYV